MPEQEIRISITFEFKRNLRGLAKKFLSIRSDLQPIIDQLLRGELPGDKIPGAKVPVYKVRIKNSDIQKGKRAGYRCIYYLKSRQDIVLVTIYSKSDQSDISNSRIHTIINEMGY